VLGERVAPRISPAHPVELYWAVSVWTNSNGAPGPLKMCASPDHSPTRKLSFFIAARCSSRFGTRGS
jgi:hypothetical protein